jgi:formylglycine-generating enzyme required for sulfatase activity
VRALIGLLGAVLIAAMPARRQDPYTSMPFVLIQAGSFEMGSPPAENGREAQELQHHVAIAKPFYLGIHEVTQREWTRVMGNNPSNFAGCPLCPVERVSYDDVERFLKRLEVRSSWRGFRLPTEAEWEYACRAGSTRAFGSSGTIDRSKANYDGDRTRPVGSYPPNDWGLFDMLGNVWEWTSDDYAVYPGAVAPDSPSFQGEKKVIRGGSWRFGADSARCALRYTHSPHDAGYSLGVRLAHDAS